jgi:uncharacterized protein (TIGR02757 family)
LTASGIETAPIASLCRSHLDGLYRRYNRRRYVDPDPIAFLYDYADPADREIVALIAAALAYGQVRTILNSVSAVLDILGPSPAQCLIAATPDAIRKQMAGFVHRFATGDHVAGLLAAARSILLEHGSLQTCFLADLHPSDETVLAALTRFANRLIDRAPSAPGHLVPRPDKGSACKRLNLMLRWLARRDAVDPGGWDAVPASKLIVPLDVHMHRMARRLGLTDRRCANMKTALEITAGFAAVCPEDPVRYDFTLTRPGIRGDLDFSEFCFTGAVSL